ncbi:MAG: hypothetical protein KKE23_04490 [Nanoarchaeota archaeon]|nr:hypothetical protein [Nanoarchaeota archaeon]
MANNKITITKKISKQGNNHMIVIPTYLREMLKAGSLVQVEITTLDSEPEAKEEENE